MWLLAIPAGLLVGLSLGTLGAGGSILTVPILVYLLGQDPHHATTISLIVVGVAAIAGAVAHHRAGRVRLGTGLVFGLLGAAGSYFGSLASATVNQHVLLLGFAALMLAAAVAMLARRRRKPAAPAPVTGGTRTMVDRATMTKTVGAATVVGLLTGFFGVGGGFAVVPALVLALGFSMPAAVGTSLLVITVNSATALASRAGHGIGVDWTVIGPFTAAAVVGSLLGGRVASRARPELLSRAFTVLLVVVALYTAARSIPQLL